MSRVCLALLCFALLSLALQACDSGPAPETSRLIAAAQPKTPAPGAFRNLGKRAESDS